MKVAIEKPGTPEELAHHGIKGMRWGVKKGYTQRQSYIGKREVKVGEGGGTPQDKYKVHSKTQLSEAIVKGGFKKAALSRGNERLAHVQRIRNGKETVADKLRLYGNVALHDITIEKKKAA